ncbi:MAG: hemerythrin domain-containing protein [Bacteriovorax sp.]|nr:hemerythrin domain-containing protein [Bacteriovorax sp.]
MKEIIEILVNDHKKIADEITRIEKLMTGKPEEYFKQILQSLSFFKEFAFNEHHRREDEILYAWMRLQNPNFDAAVMDRIKNEHTQLEKLSEKIFNALSSYLKKTPICSNVTILSDLNDFIHLYVEHMVKEERFIFMIAEGLKLNKKEKDLMLKKMCMNSH